MKFPKPDSVKTPWTSFLNGIPARLDYFDGSMCEAVERIAEKHPDLIAYDFMGTNTSYRKAVSAIHECARALAAIGIRKNDRVTIAMPNCPQAVSMFYAVNMVGAVANMIHPLSAEGEIEFYLNDSKSVAAITLDQFYGKFAAIRGNVPHLKHLIITSIGDALSGVMKIGYALTQGRKIPKLPADGQYIAWKNFLAGGKAFAGDPRVKRPCTEGAVILYSGGTTGTTKGILLSDFNFNALGAQIIATNPIFQPGDKMLAIMPMFHGFGLGVSIHSMLVNGGHCVLVPRFTPKTYAELLAKHRPNFIAGVPTLYEALLRLPGLEKLDLSCLKGMFSGGDSLPVELKKRIDQFLIDHKGTIEVLEGYGTTECVTASCLTPRGHAREGSIGIPFPDTYYKNVMPGT
ncbi:MAG: AMP-binding protein [Clostridia bacterium]|nr:AMP-binding protein [Clostridia bacterium]